MLEIVLILYFFWFFAGILRQKDVEQSLIYEEKISLLLKLLAAAGIDIGIEQPSYCHLVSEYLDIDTVRKEVFNTIQVFLMWLMIHFLMQNIKKF